MAPPTRTIRIACAIAALVVASPAFTQARDPAVGYPSRPVRIVNSGGVGGALDIPARAVADKLRERLGQPVIVENRPAVGGTLAVGQVAKSAPDGYTLIYSFTGPLAYAPHLYSKVPYDVQKDFTPVIFVGRLPFVLGVSAASGISNVKELIEAARKQPGKLNYSSAGNGSGTHLTMELLKSEAKVSIAHVPYNGGVAAATALVTGDVQAVFLPPAVLLPHVQSGRVKLIGVASIKRLPLMPDVPTVAESGLPGFNSDGWHGILAPAGTPRGIVLRLNKEINDALAAPDVREVLARYDIQASGGTPEQFGQLIASESNKWAPVIKFTGAKLD
jgi:tripartite-type tricarboxylate transporter receptor subunit TctC